MRIENVALSLADLLGSDYLAAVCRTQSALTGVPEAELRRLAEEKVEFYPPEFARRCDELAVLAGSRLVEAFAGGNAGAPTDSFRRAQHSEMAPLGGFGCVRIGEDGRIYFIGKSEHYHASLGHAFPGYRLLENAARLGIPNATHNNTRGFITRTLERELVRAANGVAPEDDRALEALLDSPDERALCRVVNLETGSLAVEGALKMLLARFYRLDRTFPEPRYAGRTPVFLVMSDYKGGSEANYHGTTVLAQTLRGMWPEFYAAAESAELYRVEPVAINSFEDFAAKVEQFDSGSCKVAGFIHELVLMNYGGIRLGEEFVGKCHELCLARDIPTVVDEIQSCMWSPEMFLFREYGLRPDFVAVGKGFPGGQYPASRLLTNRKMDSLNQFGVLVTNGQEELASLSYLITMAFARRNAKHTRYIGQLYHRMLAGLAGDFPAFLAGVDGEAHMTTLVFHRGEEALAFVAAMNRGGIDVSSQTYKADCPPVALTKLPLTASQLMVEFVVGRMRGALEALCIS